MRGKVRLISFALMFLLIPLANAENVQEYYNTGYNGDWSMNSYAYVAQNITLGANGLNQQFNITKIELLGYDAGTTASIVVKIASGLNSNQDIANGTISVIPDVASFFNVTMTYWNGSLLEPNGKYYITVLPITAGGFKLGNHDPGAYSGGSVTTNNGVVDSWWISSDLMFLVHGLGGYGLVSFVSPANDTFNLFTPMNFTVSSQSGLGGDLKNVTIFVYDQSGTVVNQTTKAISGETNTVTFEIYNLNLGRFTSNATTCDVGNNCFGSSTLTFNNGYKINSVSYNTTLSDSTVTGFMLNVSVDTALISFASGTFKYANTEYASTVVESGTDMLFYNSITTPSVTTATAKNFNWSIYLSDTTKSVTFNTTTYTQTITPTNFTICPNFSPAVNYTILDEETLKPINVSWGSTFWYALSSTATQKNYSYSGDAYSFIFCISSNTTYYVDADIILTEGGYIDKVYKIRDAVYSNATTNRYLYMLNDTIGSDIRVKVVDAGDRPLPNYLVKIYRFREETNTYDLVSEQTTDVKGLFLATLVENSVGYRFDIYNPIGELVKSEERVDIICMTNPCLISFIINDVNSYSENYLNLKDYSWSLTFSNTSKTFVFSFSDATGDNGISHRLKVVRYVNGQYVTVCNNITSNLITSLTCTVGTEPYTYIAQGFRTATGQDERQIDVISTIVAHSSDLFGREGLFWIVIALGIIVATAVYSPVTSVIMLIASILFFALSGFIYVPPIAIIVLMALGGFFAWAFKT